MSMKIILAASMAVAGVAGLASAQEYSFPPTYGEVALEPGFVPDPFEVDVVAGGTNDASRLGAGCVGLVADAPDYRLHYGEIGGQYGNEAGQLFIGATSDADTTLVINAPDGSWVCNDDFHGLNPLVGGAEPLIGQYDIWVGTYGSDLAPATIFITEYDQ